MTNFTLFLFYLISDHKQANGPKIDRFSEESLSWLKNQLDSEFCNLNGQSINIGIHSKILDFRIKLIVTNGARNSPVEEGKIVLYIVKL